MPGVAAGDLDEALRQCELAGGQRFFGARPVSRENKAQATVVLTNFEALIPLGRLPEAHPSAAALPGFNRFGRPANGVAQGIILQYSAQRIGGGNGDIFIEFEELHAVDQNPVVEPLFGQPAIGADGGAQDSFESVANRQAAGPGADQQAGDGGGAGAAEIAEAFVRPVRDFKRKTEQR